MFTKAHKQQVSGQADRSGLPFYPPPLSFIGAANSWVGGKGGGGRGVTGKEGDECCAGDVSKAYTTGVKAGQRCPTGTWHCRPQNRLLRLTARAPTHC